MKFTPLLIAAVMLPNFTSALAVPASDDTHTDADVATIQSTNGEIELRQIGTWCKPGTYTCEDPWRIKWLVCKDPGFWVVGGQCGYQQVCDMLNGAPYCRNG